MRTGRETKQRELGLRDVTKVRHHDVMNEPWRDVSCKEKHLAIVTLQQT